MVHYISNILDRTAHIFASLCIYITTGHTLHFIWYFTAILCNTCLSYPFGYFSCSSKHKGYKNIMENCKENARILREGIEKTGRFNIVSKDIGVPLVAFSLKDSSQHTVFEVADHLRKFGWIVPAYTMPPDAQHIAVLRVVIREDFSRSLAERLVSDIDKVVKLLDTLPSPLSTKAAHVTAITSETSDKVKKSASETQAEIARYWKRLVEGKRVGAC